MLYCVIAVNDGCKSTWLYVCSGGILRNMSSFIAVQEDHRRTLRRTGVYPLLLRQLGSSSLTVVSNACGSLWNLSARCAEDQQRLRDLGAVSLLRSLVNSKHKMIAMGSTAALKNLLVPRSAAGHMHADSRQLAGSPGLHARRQRSLDRDFERHSDIGDFSGPPRQLFGGRGGSQPSNGWVMSSSAGGNLFPSGPGGQTVLTEQMEEANWRRLIDSAGVKVAHSGGSGGAVSGSSSFTHGMERPFYDSQSVDNSPAVHRRVPLHGISAAVSSSLDYGPPVCGAATTYNGWAAVMSNGHGDAAASFDHLSRRMERVHFTDLPDCSQDEPINFSMKYKESTDASGSPAVQRSSSSVAVTDGNSRLQQPAVNSPLSRYHVSRQSLPSGRSNHLDLVRTSQVASYSKPQYTASASNQYSAQKFASAYGRSSIDTEQPTNYSRMYAEHYEDDECGGRQFSEQPIDYSTRYMEPPQTCRPSAVFRPDRDEHCSLDADTLQTFCTEGTPMNYQSTATSMTDLSNTRSGKNAAAAAEFHRRTHSSDDLDVDEVQDFSRKYSEIQAEDDGSSAGRPASGHRWPQQRVEGSAYSDHVRDEAGASSPGGDQPRQYCTEGTPPNFSRLGSLNSLHADGVVTKNSQLAGAASNTPTSAANNTTEKLTTRPAVDDGSGMSSLSGKSDGPRGGGPMVEMKDAAHSKTVTFDVDSNQVEQTPLMFSRSSSLGSLSSFDVRSVHSSVVSEYSVRASQVVSPSELPDSPCNTMPPSPSKSSQPPTVFFGPDVAAVNSGDNVNSSNNNPVGPDCNDINASSVMTGTADISALTVQPAVSSDQSSPVHYLSEGGNMSSRTSLSALTCDDGERVGLCKEPRCLPLGEEETGAATAAPDLSGIDNVGSDDIDGVDSPVNPDDERKLAECINLGMPKRKKASSKNTTQSFTDGDHLHQPSSLSTSSQLPAISTIKTSASYTKVDSVVKQTDLPVAVMVDTFDVDSPRQFATEDTPLNFSQSGSLTDLSVASEMAEPPDAAAGTTVTKLDTSAVQDDSDESLSDDDVPGGDEMLSYLIEAAMPKKRHHWKPAVSNMRGRAVMTGSTATDGTRRPASRSLEPPVHRVSRSNQLRLGEFHGPRNHLTNSTRQHELPANNAEPPAASEVLDQSPAPADQLRATALIRGASPVKLPPTYGWTAEPSEDHMLSYAVEGTPDSYSRDRSPTSQRIPNALVNRSLSKTGGDDASWNSSLSSLSFDSSLNAEPTAEESMLLQECINAALPKSRGGKKSTKKSSNQQQQQPLRTSPSGSSESSLKRHPVHLAVDPKTDPDITEETKPQDVSDWQPEVENGTVSAGDDIMMESLPDGGMLDIALDDESLPSGPSTEANNTVIYVGPSLPETGLPLTSSSAEPGDVTAAAALDEMMSELAVVSEISTEMTQGKVMDNSSDGPATTDLSPDQVKQHVSENCAAVTQYRFVTCIYVSRFLYFW